MKHKRLMLVLIIALIAGFIAFRGYSDYKNKQIISQEVCAVIDERLPGFFESNDAKEFGVTNVQYEIMNVTKSKSYRSDYTFTVEFRCKTDMTLDPIEKSLVAYAVEDLVSPFDGSKAYRTQNGLSVSVRDSGEMHTNTYVNNVLTHRNGERVSSSSSSSSSSNSSKSSSSKDSRMKKCPVCGREFNMGTDNSWSITTKNMCVGCYNNYKSAEKMLEDMKHN